MSTWQSGSSDWTDFLGNNISATEALWQAGHPDLDEGWDGEETPKVPSEDAVTKYVSDIVEFMDAQDPDAPQVDADDVEAIVESLLADGTEGIARHRVEHNEALDEYADEIWYDWPNWGEHVDWIATAPVSEIVAWAKSIRDDAES